MFQMIIGDTIAQRDRAIQPAFKKPRLGNAARGKGNRRRGSFHGMAVAADAAVTHARARHKVLKSYALVAAEIGVGVSTVRDWVKGRTRA